MKRGGVLALAIFSALSLMVSACSSAAPMPTQAPAAATKGAESPKPATEAAAPAPKPSIPPKEGSAAKQEPAVGADTKADWDNVLAAARKEGKVVVAGGRAEAYRLAVLPFQEAYPDIKLEYTGVDAAQFSPKITAEREAGQFLWDLYMGGASQGIIYKNQGMLEPLKPSLLLPEIRDDRNWVGGMDEGWMDKEHQYVYQFDGAVLYLAYVNRDLVKDSELNSIDQLLDPKWKGQIVTMDPRMTGAGSTGSATALLVKGEDWLRKLLSQDLILVNEGRQEAEMVIRGRYPIGIRISPADLKGFQDQGLGTSVEPLDPTGPAAATVGVGFGSVEMFNKGPHPNAAKVLINWVLSKEGQDAYAKAAGSNSRRLGLDDPGPADTAPNPNVKYPMVSKEENLPYIQRAQDIAKEIIK